MANIPTRIALKHATADQWKNSTLSALPGEYLYDETNRYIKVGDGTKTWNELQGIRISADSVDGLSDRISTEVNAEEQRATAVEESLVGSIAVNTEAIATEATRALSAEAALETKLEGEIAAETARASAAEEDLESRIGSNLSGVSINGESFTVTDRVAAFTIDIISCGGAD